MFEGKGHFSALMPAVDTLLTGAEVEPGDIKGVAVATGPGSFTGLRVGLSLAKGFCHALHVPIMGISSLRALAFQLPFTEHPIAPILSSRKGGSLHSPFSMGPGKFPSAAGKRRLFQDQ